MTSSNNTAERLFAFVEIRIKKMERDGNEKLTEQTSLIRSGLFDSLALLQLAEWIEAEVGETADFRSLDPTKSWDSVADIVRYVESRRRVTPC